MAELKPNSHLPSAGVQLAAVAWMRWRMFANGFRKKSSSSGQVVGLVLTMLLRLIVWPVMALWMIGPALGAGFFAWQLVSSHHPNRLGPMLALVFVIWQFLGINGLSIAATTANFDPSSLVRFPLPFGRYLLLRLLLGFLTPSTVTGCLALLAAALGIGIADHALFLRALFVLAVYGCTNIFFARMIGAWMERWLATRRAREIFGVLMAFFFVGIQFINFRRIGGPTNGQGTSWMLHFVNGSFPMLRWLPPSFAAKAILLTTRPMLAAGAFSGLLAWTIGFLAIFALRLHKQFLGEYLSEGPARQTPASARATRVLPIASGGSGSQAKPSLIPPAIAACLRKEYMYLRGNGSQLIGMLTPLLFVVILSRGLFAHHPAYLLPGSLGYVLFALLAGLYNIFGADGAGVQLYLMAPVRFRDVIFAKNLVSLSLILSEALLAWFVVLMVATAPIPASAQVSTWCWVVFVVAVNLTVGTLRSIQAPRKFVPGQVRQMRTPTNRTSSLLAVGILLGSILLQVPVMLLCRHLGRPWLATMIFGPLAAAAVMGYFVLLQFVDRMILAHRDVFAGELCGV